MARYNGRVIVSKVDANGKKIKEKLSVWIAKHPGEMYFDSLLEQEVWEYLDENKINHETKKEILLFDSCNTTEFKDGKICKVKQRPMKFTPDYYLPDYDTYIEVKGFAEEAFKMRWKLFKLAGHTGYLVYSLKEFVEVLKLLKESTKKQN
jgi:hypothetical protein